MNKLAACSTPGKYLGRCGFPRRLWLALLYHLELFERS